MRRILIHIGVLFFCSCSHHSDREYSYWVDGASGMNIKWFVNDQPVLAVTYGGVAKEISNFLLKGENEVTLEVAASGQDLHYRPSLKRVSESNYMETEVLLSFDPSSAQQSTTFRVNSSVPRWSWLRADKLSSLSAEDKANIEDCIREFHAAFILKDYARLKDFDWVPWEAGLSKESYLEEIISEDYFEDLTSSKNYACLPLNFERIEYIQGENVVLAHTKDRVGIIYAGLGELSLLASLKAEEYISFPDLHFIRDNGRWILLL